MLRNLNGIFRFFLELAALIGIGFGGRRLHVDLFGILAAVVLPIIAAILWGAFAVPDDPSRSGKAPVPVSGKLRLMLEAFVFIAAAVGYFFTFGPGPALFFLGAVLIHYSVSSGRIKWLLKQ